MTNDPYAGEDRYALAGVAINAFVAVPSDSADLPVFAKAVDLVNQGATWQRVDLVPVGARPAGRAVQFFVPPGSVRPVPLRVRRVLALNKGADVTVVCYTDGNAVDGLI
jgi:hypothetical protein